MVTLFVILVIVIGVLLMLYLTAHDQRQSSSQTEESSAVDSTHLADNSVIEASKPPIDLVPNLHIDKISSELFNPSKHSLAKVTNNSAIAKLDSLIQLKDPALNIANAMKSAKESGELFRVILHKGGELTQRGNGSYFGFSKSAGKFVEHAELIKQAPELSQTIGNAVNAGMNIASMIVGQYYMSEINDKLKSIDGKLSQISQFQENEKIAELIGIGDEIHIMNTFTSDIFEHEDRKSARLHQIQSLRQQVNTLSIFANKQFMDTINNFDSKGDYNEMKKLLSSLEIWDDMRMASAQYLDEILKLEIIFSTYGSIPMEEILSQRNKVYTRTLDANNKLEEFSKDYVSKYGKKWEKKLFNRLDGNRYHKSVYIPLSKILDHEIVPIFAIEDTFKAIENPTELIIDENGDVYYTVINEGDKND